MIDKGFTLQCWGAPLPNEQQTEKMFEYFYANHFNIHVLQHTARPGWTLTHLQHWLPFLSRYNMKYILEVCESNTLLSSAPTSEYIIGEYQKALNYCESVYPQGLHAVSCAKETDWTYKGTFNQWKNYVDSLYIFLSNRVNVPVLVVENGSTNWERRDYMRSLNGIYATHWFAGYEHCISGRAYQAQKEIIDRSNVSEVWFTECGCGTNENATYEKMDPLYINQILKCRPKYMGFWYAGGD